MDQKSVWVLKTTSDGNLWAQVPIDSIRKEGKTWKCSECIQVETPTPAKKRPKDVVQQGTIFKQEDEVVHNTKVVCIGGMCKVQPKEARYYEFVEPNVNAAVSIHGATYGDILARQNTLRCEESYIINKHGVPEKLTVDLDTQCVIPDSYLKDLGVFYWDNISAEASLANVYNRKKFADLRQQLIDGHVHMEGLLQQYGPVVVAELVAKPPEEKLVKKPSIVKKKVVEKKPVQQKLSKVVKKKVVKKKVVQQKPPKVVKKKLRGNLEKRTIAELKELAVERGRKIPSGATKVQIIELLRGKMTVKCELSPVKREVKKARRGCYEAMTKGELMKRATERKIEGRSKMSKEQLINALRKK